MIENYCEGMNEKVLQSVADLYSEGVSLVDERKLAEERVNPEFDQEFVACNHLLSNVDLLREDSAIQELMSDALFDSEDPKSEPARHWGGMVVAASLLLSLFLGGYLYFGTQDKIYDGLSRYVTRVGEQKTITLGDGSVVTLNTGSRILVDIGLESRRVILERGEVYFDVMGDPERPFTIEVGGQSVTVLGTEFNIQRDVDRFVLAVIDGVVVVHPQSEAALASSRSLANSGSDQVCIDNPRQYRVDAGWLVEYDFSNDRLEGHWSDDLTGYGQWRTGMLKFSNVPLYKVVRDLNRYSGKKILIEDKSIMDLPIYAALRIDRLDAALLGLERGNPIKISQYFDRIVIVGSDF